MDKNYSIMQGRPRFLLEYDGLDSALSSPLNDSLSSLLSTYLHFVPIQAIYIAELHPEKISNKKSMLSRVEIVVQDLLDRLERVHARITGVRPWSCLMCTHADLSSYTDLLTSGAAFTWEVNLAPFNFLITPFAHPSSGRGKYVFRRSPVSTMTACSPRVWP